MDVPLLRVQEAARLLKVSKWTIYRWVDEGRLEATKIGRGSLRIFRPSLKRLIESHRTDQEDLESDRRGNIVRLRSSIGPRKRQA